MVSLRYRIFVVLLLAGAVAAAHGGALWDGLFLDDHWHLRRLQESDWSLSAFLHATTIVPERFMNTWWQERPLQWQYIRPFAMFVSKVVYHLSGGSVKALHAVSILLHFANALMIYELCLRLTRRQWWSIVGALLVVVYSHSVYAVAWLAAQNAVLQTTLTLAALLCYIRASGLDIYAAPLDPDRPTTRGWTNVPRLKLGAFAACLLLWCLALLSRETAIVLPVIMAAFDLAFGGRSHLLARWRAYLWPVVIGVAFVVWRLVFFYAPMPDFYVRRPDGIGDVGYVLWWIAKLLHYVTATVWLSPMTIGPTGRFNPWREVPADCILMIVLLTIMSAGYYMASRRVRGWWIWPLWIFLALLPTVPIMAAPHQGYMPSMGFAIAMVIGAALRDRTRPTSIGRWCPGVATWFLIATTIYMPIYHPMWDSFLAAERLTVARIQADPPPKPAKDLFFINLPFVNIYIRYHLDEAFNAGRPAFVDRSPEPEFRTHVLTYATNLLRMEGRCRLEQIDAHTFRLIAEGDTAWFDGALGRWLIESMRPAGRLTTGDTVEDKTGQFEVQVTRADDRGVRELEFRFKKPLTSPDYCFYFGTERNTAAKVTFLDPQQLNTAHAPIVLTPDADAPKPPPSLQQRFDTLRWQRDAIFRIQRIASRVIQTDLYLTGPPFPGPR